MALQPESPYVPERTPDPSRRLEFSPESKRRFDAILDRYPNKQAALLPVLHLAQEEFGWTSPEVMVYVAELLDLTPAYVFGVVSFYNMYNQKPVGKHLMQVCTNLSCMIRGAYDIFTHLHEKLHVPPSGVTEDGLFSLMEVECLGSCDTAPVVQINNDYHENTSVAEMDAFVEKARAGRS